MRVTLALLILVTSSFVVLADDMSDAKTTGRGAASSVLSTWGSSEGLSERGMKPLSTSGSMESNDGTAFNVSMDCPAPEKFMRVSMFPQNSGDIQQIGVEIDTDNDNVYDNTKGFAGPFAAVCANGVISCAAGSFNNCNYLQWAASGFDVSLKAVDKEDVGTCYCINNSCGNSLVFQNAAKILTDLGQGIGVALKSQHPRLALGSGTINGVTDVEYFASESSCISDKAPEQYYTHAQDLPAAGMAEKANTSSTAYFIDNSQAANNANLTTSSCVIERNIAIDNTPAGHNVERIHTQGYAPYGTSYHSSCGYGCKTYLMGNTTKHVYQGGSCTAFEHMQTFLVKDREAIVSVVLSSSSVINDYLDITINGSNVVNDKPNNPNSCQKGDHGGFSGINVTTAFKNLTDGKAEYKHVLYVGNDGQAGTEISIQSKDMCALGNDYFAGSCAGLEGNSDCVIKNEWVDGVQTVSNHQATGLYPTPTIKNIEDCGQRWNVERPYWEIKREYSCTSSSSPYDFDALGKRQDKVSGSFDPETGDFGDTKVNENGSWSDTSENVTLPPPDQTDCFSSCKVRTPIAGSGISEAGPQSQNNRDSIAWDYTYKSCEEGVCPIDASNPNEQMVEDCSCASSFGQAATYMQLIRMTAQDMICTED